MPDAIESRPRPPTPPRMQQRACMEPLPEALTPDNVVPFGGSGRHCAKPNGHDGEHQAWVQVRSVIVTWAPDPGDEQ